MYVRMREDPGHPDVSIHFTFIYVLSVRLFISILLQLYNYYYYNHRDDDHHYYYCYYYNFFLSILMNIVREVMPYNTSPCSKRVERKLRYTPRSVKNCINIIIIMYKVLF